MLKLYFARPSGYARPVWLALLEKELPFELISVDLRGGQFEPEFLAISPFGHVPVLVDGNVSLFEMTAILDYLEARYPEPTLQAQTPLGKGQVRLVQSVTFSELLPALFGLLKHEPETEAWIDARSRRRCCRF
ncbi:MAG: glutathione S-transferase family protein [Synechococcaceae cyanobacterium SM2_3_60]|nr:glutathione S-transferase family protein [Synechococcaceae cyanobacterium SM2_3_60]